MGLKIRSIGIFAKDEKRQVSMKRFKKKKANGS